jgi:hypothetical protein
MACLHILLRKMYLFTMLYTGVGSSDRPVATRTINQLDC